MSYELKKPFTEEERVHFIIQYNHSLGLRIEETELYLFALEENEIMGEKEVEGHLIEYPIVDPDWDEKQKAKEEARILSLSMTRSDFFDGTIKAFGADSDDLLVAIRTVLSDMPIPEVEKKVAINNYKNALNFYRKHPLFTMISGVPIPVSEEVTILVTSEQWDNFFSSTAAGDPDAYRELLPHEVPEEDLSEGSPEETGETEIPES